MAENEIGARLTLKDRKQFSDDADRAARDIRHIGREADRADGSGRRMGSGLGVAKAGLRGVASMAKVGVAALGLATAAITAFVVKGINSLNRIEVIAAQTDAAIRSTGGVANVTRSEIDALAGSLESLTGTEAETITQGQNLLLTFTKIQNQAGEGNDIFDQATVAMVNMSVALGTDVSGAALQLGKALNDPIRGVGALSRAGVSFTQEQKDQIKVLQESGDMLGAQKIIMGELETQFGGSAEAYGNTTKGLTDRTKHLFGTLQENLVTAFTPAIDGALQRIHDRMETLVGSSEEWIPKIGAAISSVGDAFQRAKGVWQDGGSFGETLASLTGIQAVQPIVDKVADVFGDLWTIIRDGIIPAFESVANNLPNILSPMKSVDNIVKFLAEHAEGLSQILAILIGGFILWKAATFAANAVMAIHNGILFITSGRMKAMIVQSTIAKAATVLWTGVQWLLNAAMSANPIGLMVAAIVALVAIFIVAWKNSETFRNIVTGAFNAVWGVIKGVWNWISENWPLLLAILTGPIGLVVLAITRNWDTIKEGVTGVYDWIVEKFDAVVSFVTGLPGRVTSAVSGMWDGIKDAFKTAINWIIDGWNGLEFKVPELDLGPLGSIGGWTVGMPDIPRLHTGGTTTTAGMVNMKPGEELVFLPPAASVVPMTDNVQSMAASVSGGAVGGSREPMILQVVLDRKVIAEAVYDHAGDRMARA